MNLGDIFGGIGDSLNEVGSRIRYGVSPTEKYKMLASRSVPGMPKPYLASGDENPEATRFLSNYLGTKQWGSGPTQAFNSVRNFFDPDEAVYNQGLRGQKQAQDEEDNYLSELF